MQPWKIVDRAHRPDGTEVVLARRGEEWVIRTGGLVHMSSRMHGSEEALASLALGKLEIRRTILIGGLGLGFTLRAVLDRVPVDARVIVADLVPEIATWNRGPVAHLAGRCLDDARVRLQIGDVAGRIAEATKAFDAILLDVENGPSSIGHAGKGWLYGQKGVRACLDALKPGGVLAVWSAGPDHRYVETLEQAGFATETRFVSARSSGGGVRHVIHLGTKRARRGAARPPL